MRYLKLNLFDGEAAAAPEGTENNAESTVIYGKPTETQDPDNHVANGESSEERTKAFEDLIKGEYKDLYDERVKKEIYRRLGDKKKLENQLKTQKEVLDLIGMKYGVDSSDMDGMRKAMEEDKSYWEEAAEREGLTVEQYKKFRQMEAENRSLREAKEERERITQREKAFAEWEKQAEELRAVYPSFSLQEEIQNPDFQKLLGVGINMRTAYEAVNHERLTAGAMAFTAQAVAKKQADAIRSGQARPIENGISSRGAVEIKADPSKLTRKDMQEIARRVRNGEIIRF